MSLQSHARIRALAGAIGACAMLLISIAGVAHAAGLDPVTADVSGRVADSATGLPLQAAQIEILKRDQVVATVISDAFGRFLIHNIATGTYTVRVRRLGFRAESRDVRVADGGTINLDFELVAAPITLAEISVSLAVPITIDTRNGDQQYQEDEYHGAPSSTTSQILQQVITGA